jgi:hypothetical protein
MGLPIDNGPERNDSAEKLEEKKITFFCVLCSGATFFGCNSTSAINNCSTSGWERRVRVGSESKKR